MTRSRLEFALLNLNPTQWESFEQLASTFLADQYSQLRTLAGTGDRGRDAVLWQPDGDPTVVLQYSVSQDWSQKIHTTARLLHRNFPDSQVLIYATNARIGPKADDLRTEVQQDFGLFLDIRDATWFLERENRSLSTASAAEIFSAPIVEPLLAESSLIVKEGDTLTAGEARAAVIFLSMKWEDRSRAKGLTKLSFEALVTAALRDTDNDRRISRSDICKSVRGMIQHHDPVEIDKFTNSALERLKKRVIRHWQQSDEFCLSFDERQRRTEALVELELLDSELNLEVLRLLEQASTAMEYDISVQQLTNTVHDVRRVLELFLLQRGEAFAQSLSDGQMVLFTADEIKAICVDYISRVPRRGLKADNIISLVSSTIEGLLVRPTPHAQRYLRALADGYTLFAFLQQVPDVQRAVQKIFSHGRIWLDTSAALPLLAEMLLDEEERSYTRTIRAARNAGMDLYVTGGVIEELYRHILHARRCQQLGLQWRSRMPFLFSAYLWSGRPTVDFKKWTTEFMGDHQPHDDIADFLFEVAGITNRSLAHEVERADDNFRWRVVTYWQEVHLARSQASDGSRDQQVAKLLADHDIENFLGVVMARETESRTNSLGHEHWWLTLDRRAYRATGDICEQEGIEPFDSPVMSYDFLINYVAVGPQRASLTKTEERLLPLMLDMSLLDEIPEGILEIAEATRADMTGSSERLVRREIRDRLNRAKLRKGPVSRGGLEAIERDLREAFGTMAID